MASIGNTTIKALTATGAVTTDNTGGILYQVDISGDTAGDAVEILDGASSKFKILITEDGLTTLKPPEGVEWKFATDIDCTITKAGNITATFTYAEIR
jgi:hydroxymethylpyrimidine pyrophosphatase-like HAD family hydrolase|tara:strand:- start:450 stop:743 length:294 start_codon:yes stop_codon:yes gene_type:complete